MIGSRVFLSPVPDTCINVTEETPGSNTHYPYLPYSKSLALGLVTLWVVYLCISIMQPFLSVLAWAVALAVATHPLSTWLKARIDHPTIASSIALTLGTIIICIPVVWVTRLLMEATLDNVTLLIQSMEMHEWIDPAHAPPRLRPLLTWLEHYFHLQQIATNLIHTTAEQLPHLITMSLVGVVQFLLILFTAFFFIRDGQLFLAYLKWILPLSPSQTEEAVFRVFDTVHVCLFGIVLMAALQGALGGLIFWWLELPHPILWGVAMGCLAIVPYLGAFVIWVPTSIALALHGEWNSALILVAWGALVIGLADNFLYPLAVGKRLHYHTLLVFFFLFGGVLMFGSSGVIIGPMIMSIAHGLGELWQHQAPHRNEAPSREPSS
jgi:predicted PurR-regulated permease PerM